MRSRRSRASLAGMAFAALLASTQAAPSWTQEPVQAPAEPAVEVAELPSPYLGALDHLETSVEKGRYHGVVALVEVAGERVLESSHGVLHAGKDAPMPMDAIFRIYSMSKPITAAAAMVLVDAGKLDLDAPVAQYLPEFEGLEVGVEKKSDGKRQLQRVPAKRPMTVRDLGCHRSGLTYGIFAQSAVDRLVVEAGTFAPDVTNAKLVERLATVPLKHQPGARFEYSLSSDVLGRVIEVASGQTLDLFLHEQLFAPLGMLDTGFDVPAEKLDRVTSCYVRSGGSLAPAGPGQALDPAKTALFHSGGGGLYSTAADYLRFCQMLLGQGALGEVRVLSEASVKAMLSDQLEGIPAPMLIGTGGAFGLGLAITTLDREQGPHQGTAWWGGYAGTGFWIDPKAQAIGVFMIQNVNEFQHTNAFQRSVYQALGR